MITFFSDYPNACEKAVEALPSEFPSGSLRQTFSRQTESSTQVSVEFIYNSPEKTRLRDRLNYLTEYNSKKIRRLTKKINRQNERINKLLGIIDETVEMRLLTAEQAEGIGPLGRSIVELLDRFTKKLEQGTIPREYPAEL